MKLTILGGGGFRVPMIYGALLSDSSPERITEIVLYDVDAKRLDVINRVLKDQAKCFENPPKIVPEMSLKSALEGTDFVFSAFRVGGLRGRVLDECIALKSGVIGQETVGAGGISFALRTIPTAKYFAEAIKRYAPHAWTINFTNPAGVITEAMASILGERVIGICDSPVSLVRHVLDALHVDQNQGEIAVDYVGLNHLGWLRGLSSNDKQLLPAVLSSAKTMESFEEGKLFGSEWIQSLGAIPNEYLYYYYFTREQLVADLQAKEIRGDFLAHQQQAFYDRESAGGYEAYPLWQQTQFERTSTYMETNRSSAGNFERSQSDLESGGYEKVALSVMKAITSNERSTLILNTPNRGTFNDLDNEAVIEVPCWVDGNGAKPIPTSPLPDYARPLVIAIKNVERHELAAVEKGSRQEAFMAFAEHPLVDSVRCARTLVDKYVDAFPQLDYLR